ncbi:MAG: DUF4397 domain-containing protein [Armatimonadetes bacterium]|nr:DUF4397 domain-containing protein [Armatimonadota bacterium]
MLRITGMLLGCVAALALSGCGGGGGTTALPKPQVMFFNAGPDNAGIDFYIDSVLSGNAVASAAGTDFMATDPVARDLIANATGTTTDYDAILQTFARNKHYVISALGLVTFGTEFEKRLRLTATEVDRHTIQGNKSRLVIFHGFSRATGFLTPNIDFQSPGQNPQYKAANIEFGASSVLTIDSGTHSFDARRAGSDDVFVSLVSFAFGTGKMYLVYVMGVEGGAGAQTPQIVVKEIPTGDYP